MKKIITFIILVVSIAGMAQGVTVTTTQTPSQLINDVLISSPCFIATNVVASTGTNFGSTNGIGYFSNVNPNFPFASGVVLTTGDVTKVPSPNNAILNDGILSWPGDSEMQTALLGQGVNINSVNASSIQFQFTATTTTFNLSFVFASEEYGASQCNFSDAFAFLIKDITAGGSYQNLATVPFPAPANTPITVSTIRDSIYNTNCPSVNPTFFGEYNGGGFGPAINFNGQTIPMNASAPLIVTHVYQVKLVVADGNGNVGYDSAIFLQAKSLNIGGDVLGSDYISANAGATPPRNGICSPVVAGSCPILQPDVPLQAGTTYQWKKLLSGIYQNIPGQTSSTLDICSLTPAYNAPTIGLNYYSLTYTRIGCEPITDIIVVEVFQPINALVTVPPLTKCNTGAADYTFDLSKTANVITTNNTTATNDDLNGVTITFHTSPNSNVAVPTLYTVASGPAIAGVTLYARIKNNISGCSVIRSFELKVVAPPTIQTQPSNLILCGETPSPGPRASFDLNNNLALMLGNQNATSTIYAFSFHTTQLGANTSSTTNPLFMPTTNIKNTTSIEIYIRLQNILDPTCFVTASFTVTVIPLAYVDILPDVIVCNNFVLPALTQANSTYWTLTGGLAGGGSPYVAGAIITPGPTPTTIWVYNENGNCKTNDSFKITKANLATIAPANVSKCQTDNYTLPTLAYGTYYMLAGGPNIAGGNTQVPNTIFDTPGAKNLHIWFENTTETPACGQNYPFTITIIPFTLLPAYTNKFACSSYNLTAAGNGATYYTGPNKGMPIISPGNITATKTIWVYKESGTNPTNCTSETSFTVSIGITSIATPANVDSCTPYPLPTLDYGIYAAQPNGGTPYAVNAVISAIGQTIVYFYVPGQSCTGNISFEVNIALPALTPIPDVPSVPSVCDQYTLPYIATHPNGKYYTGPLGTGTQYANSNIPDNPQSKIYTLGLQTIYFYEKAATGTCYVQDDFQLTIYASPQISQRPISVVTCNQSFVLDDLEFGEYYKFQGGPSNTNPVLSPLSIISANDTGFQYSEIWVYANSSNSLNTCFQEYSIKIYLVNTTVNPIADITQCDNYTLPAIVGPGDYWNAPGGPLGGGTKILPPYNDTAKIITSTTTLYVYAEDNNRVACSDEDPFTVTIVKTPDLVAQTNPISICDSYTMPQYNDPMFTFTTSNPGVVTKFYKNPGGAAGNPSPLDVYTLPLTITNTNADFSPLVKTFYPYAETLGTGVTCFDDEPFVVTINRTPVIVAAEVVNVTACDTYILPNLTRGKYYPNNAHISSEELDTLAEKALTATSTTVYVYAESGTLPNCPAAVQSFVVTINKTPVFTAEEVADVFECNSYILPALSIPGAKYYTAPDGPNGTGTVIPDAQEYTNDVTVYAYAATGTTPNCAKTEEIVISVYNVIIAANVTVCDTYQLPDLVDPNANYYTQPNKGGTQLSELSFIDNSQTVYINGTFAPDSTCSDESSFDVTIVTTPTINPIVNKFSCESYTIPAYSSVTSSTPITKFYKNAGGIANNPLLTDVYTPAQIINNTGNTPLVFTVYAYAQAGSVPCFKDEPFVVTINKSPVIVASEVVPVTKCDTYTLPSPLTVGNYFSDAQYTIPITNFTLTTTQTVYVYAKNGTNPNICTATASFIVTINKTPQFTAAEVADVSKCNSYTLPPLSIAGAKYYTGDNATGSEILAGNIYTSDTTVYAYAETATTPNCFVSESISIQIYNVIELLDVTACGEYKLPDLADPNAGYYQFSGGIGFIAEGTTLSNSQTVYVYGTSTTSSCTDESDFVVTINGQPIANNASDSVCDDDSSPYDGITAYDFTKPFITNQILGTQNPADFTITYYSNFNRTVQIIDPTISALAEVYVFVTNNLSPTCPSPAMVTINVVPTPNPKLDVPPICIDSETGVVTNSVIESGYNSLQYNIVWTKVDGTVVSNNQTFSTDVPGDYILNVSSNTITACASAPVPFTVIESAKPAVTPPISFEITDWFSNSQTITVTATPYIGNGSNFVYSLDGQTPQVLNVFTNVGPGVHEITVIDINGCGSRSLPIPVQLVTSPPAFTPNGDGINDRWDIKGDISYTTLTIYDRFGRLLKQLTQNSGGWDGTINSKVLPADDYWFSLNYLDSSGAPREFKSHFSLIR